MRAARPVRAGYAVGLVALAVAIYLPVVGAYFVGDDFEGILEVVRRGSFGAFEHEGGNFRPVAWLTLAVDHWLWGNEPAGFHLFNIVAHAANGLLVAALTGSLIAVLQPGMPGDRRRLASAIAGVFFVLLPSHTEAVSWIAGRGDVVMTTGSLVALLCWLRAVPDAQLALGHGSRRTWLWRLGSCAAFAAALLTKEAAITLPVVGSMLSAAVATRGPNEHSPNEHSPKGRISAAQRRTVVRAALGAWPLYCTAAAFLVVRRVVRGNFVSGYGDQFEDEGLVRLAGKAVVAVARSMLPGAPVWAWAVMAGIGTVGMAAAVLMRRNRGPLLAAGERLIVLLTASALLVCVVPMVAAGVNLTDTAGERLVYLPSVFGVIGVAVVLSRLVALRPRPGAAAVGLVAIVAAAVLVHVNVVWVRAGEVSERLVADTSAWTPGDPLVVLNSPDSLRGAYVFRNAMAGSLALIHGWEAPEVAEVAGVELAGTLDRVRVDRGRCDRCLRITLLEEGSSFVRVATAGSEWEIDGIVATAVSARELEVRFAERPEGSDVEIWYLDGGRLVRARLDG